MRVMIVDDSALYRMAIQKALSPLDGIEIAYKAANGKVALSYLKQNADVDIITLDMEMPEMDGLETIKKVREINSKVFIICFSSQTLKGGVKTIEALSLGANDYVPKVTSSGAEEGIKAIQDELIPKIKAYAKSQTKRVGQKVVHGAKLAQMKLIPLKPSVICIGSSTGGPEALRIVFEKLNGTFNIPFFLTQHMPPVFTGHLAKKLDSISGLTVKEGVDGEIVKNGVCYIAPGDYHMKVVREGDKVVIRLNQDDKVCYVRPAVDVLFESVAEVYKNRTMAIVLTGMGSDGTNGSKLIKDSGGTIYVQDEATSVVWGMPGSIYESGLTPEVLPITEFSDLIKKSVG